MHMVLKILKTFILWTNESQHLSTTNKESPNRQLILTNLANLNNPNRKQTDIILYFNANLQIMWQNVNRGKNWRFPGLSAPCTEFLFIMPCMVIVSRGESILNLSFPWQHLMVEQNGNVKEERETNNPINSGQYVLPAAPMESAGISFIQVPPSFICNVEGKSEPGCINSLLKHSLCIETLC